MLYYHGIADLPGKMAHSIQEMRMCEAFTAVGQDVTYCHSHVLGECGGKVTWEEVAEYYGLETRFTLKTFRSLHGKTGRFVKLGAISWIAPVTGYTFAQVLLKRLSSDDIIYGRDFYPLYFLSELVQILPKHRQPPIYFEQHNPINKRFMNRFYQRIDGVVCVTEKLADHLAAEFPIERDRLFVAPDGVDRNPYPTISKTEARRRIGLPTDEPIVMYTGHLYKGKGVETLVEAARGLNASIYIVGGYNEDVQRVKRDVGHPDNVVFTGFVEPSEIPVYQIAADVLVAPYTEASRPWVSPLKLFEYMAAGRPIVASDREVLQEVLVDGENALIFEKGNADALCEAIRTVLADETVAERLSQAVRADVEAYTWEKRAERILEFVNKNR